MKSSKITRRKLIESTSLAMAGLALGATTRLAASDPGLPLIQKEIPSSGEKLTVVGVGTNKYGTDDPESLGRIQNVLNDLPVLGGSLVDTAQGYGKSEEVIGTLVEAIGNRDELFIATKTPTRGDVTPEVVAEAYKRLRTDTIDLFQVHNFNQTETALSLLNIEKAEGRARYVGCSTSSDRQYGQLKIAMNDHDLDFIQVDYSIANRSAAEEILPMAMDKGIAVLINMPFGGRRNAASTFAKVSEVELPDWAAEADIASWAQFFLKYVVSHPAVTAAIPGMTKPHHLADNMLAARGRLPDEELRREMEALWKSL